MVIVHDVPARDLEPGTIVLWKTDELYFVVSAPVRIEDNPEYGTVVLREQDGRGFQWDESIWMPQSFTTIVG